MIRIEFNGGLITAALVDSGAKVSAISIETLEKIFPNYHNTLKHCDDRTFHTASGDKLHCLGSLPMKFKIENVTCDVEMFVFKSLSQNVILGRDWMEKYRVSIDFANKLIEFNVDIEIAVVSDTKLKPGEVCIIQGKNISKDNVMLPTGLHGVLTPVLQRDGLQVIDIAVTCCGNGVPLLLQNTSEDCIEIKSNTVMATFEPLNEKNCMKIDGTTHAHSTCIGSTTRNTHNMHNVHSQFNEFSTADGQRCEDNGMAALGDTRSSGNDETELHTEQGQVCDEQLEFNLDKSDCTPEQKKRLETLLLKHQSAFVTPNGKLGYCPYMKHKIHIKENAVPVCKMPYRYPPHVKKCLDKQLDYLLKQGVIEENPDILYSSPLLAVKKSVKKSRKHLQKKATSPASYRLVLDLRSVNANSLVTPWQIPSLGSILDVLAENRQIQYFSTLDLRSGYWQLGLEDDSKKYTGFIWNGISYSWNRCCQGLSGAPFSFSRLMAMVLKPHIHKCVVIYLDDVLIWSKDFETHLQDIDKVLTSFEKANLKLSPEKCVFMTKKCEFLGHSVTPNGITPSHSHAHAIATFPVPAGKSQLKSFIGICQYFSNFIPNKGKLLAPLLQLTRKGSKYEWSDICQTNFEKLKHIISHQPLLSYPNFEKSFYAFSDSSDTAIGGCIMQKDDHTGKYLPVGFCGRNLKDHELPRPILEKECLAAMFVISTFHMYLSGRRFTLFVDNNSLKHVLNSKKKISAKLERWILFLGEYDMQILHVPGKLNQIADALSRRTYTFSSTAADERIDDFPYIPGLEGHVKEKIQAITRAQNKMMVSEQKRNDEEKEWLQTAQLALPFPDESNDTITSDANKVTRNKKRVHWRNSKLLESKTPKRDRYDTDEKQMRDTDIWKDESWSDVNLNGLSRADISTAQAKDQFCDDLLTYLRSGDLPPTTRRQRLTILREHDYCILGSTPILYQIWSPRLRNQHMMELRVVIPKSLQNKVIEAVHTSGIGCHLGMDKTVGMIRSRFIWAGLVNQVRIFVGNCECCLLSKTNQKLETAERTLFDIAQRPFEMVGTDFMGAFQPTKAGYMYICVCICYATSFVIAWPTRNMTAETFAKDFYNNVCTKFSTPRVLVSDRGPCYISKVWANISSRLGIKLAHTSGFMANSNGKTERSNATILNLLRCLVADRPKDWDQMLSSVIFAMNNSVTFPGSVTPNMVVFGRDLPCILDNVRTDVAEPQPMSEVLEMILTGQDAALKIAIQSHAARDRKLKEVYDSKVKDSPLVPGTVVFWQRPIIPDPRSNKKLQRRGAGPYIIVERQGSCVKLKHLWTAQVVKHMVNIKYLKRPSLYRYRQLDENGEEVDNTPTGPQEAPKLPKQIVPNEE